MRKIRAILSNSDFWFILGSLIYLIGFVSCIVLCLMMEECAKLYIIFGAVTVFIVVFGTLCLCKSIDCEAVE